MRVVGLVGIAACGFSGPAVDGVGIPDAAPVACTIAPGPSVPAAGNLGEQLSAKNPVFQHGAGPNAIACKAGELPIGLGAKTTMIAVVEGGTERVVRSVHVWCGSLAFGTTGLLGVTFAESIETPYAGCEPAWGVDAETDVIVAPAVSCPNGQVPVGLVGNGGTGSLFNTVSLACAPLDALGNVGPAAGAVAVTDTGNYSNNHQVATCPANTALVSYSWRGNCGVDELTPVCAALSCH